MTSQKRRVEKAPPIDQKSATSRTVRGPRGKVFTREAGIFKLLGIGDSGVPGGYSARKHELGDCGQKHHPRGQ